MAVAVTCGPWAPSVEPAAAGSGADGPNALARPHQPGDERWPRPGCCLGQRRTREAGHSSSPSMSGSGAVDAPRPGARGVHWRLRSVKARVNGPHRERGHVGVEEGTVDEPEQASQPVDGGLTVGAGQVEPGPIDGQILGGLGQLLPGDGDDDRDHALPGHHSMVAAFQPGARGLSGPMSTRMLSESAAARSRAVPPRLPWVDHARVEDTAPPDLQVQRHLGSAAGGRRRQPGPR